LVIIFTKFKPVDLFFQRDLATRSLSVSAFESHEADYILKNCELSYHSRLRGLTEKTMCWNDNEYRDTKKETRHKNSR